MKSSECISPPPNETRPGISGPFLVKLSKATICLAWGIRVENDVLRYRSPQKRLVFGVVEKPTDSITESVDFPILIKFIAFFENTLYISMEKMNLSKEKVLVVFLTKTFSLDRLYL